MILHAVGLDAALDVWLEAVLGSGTANDSGPDASSLLVAIEDLGDASVRDAQLPGNDAGTDASGRQFDNLQSDVVGQWTSVDEDSAQLINTSLTCWCLIKTNKIKFKDKFIPMEIRKLSARHQKFKKVVEEE